MSAPPSSTKPPGDDFVLWPEGLAQASVGVDEGAIKGALAGLAPAEWVRAPEEEAAKSAGPREATPREERFYPASRSWFRTTAALAPGDTGEKWWQDSPAARSPEPAARTPGPAIPPPPADREERPAATSGPLLSPEEIWELAAEELAHASRLRAPAALSSAAPSSTGIRPPSAPSAASFDHAAPPPAAAAPTAAPAVAPVEDSVDAPVNAPVPSELTVALRDPAATLPLPPGVPLSPVWPLEVAAATELNPLASAAAVLPDQVDGIRPREENPGKPAFSGLSPFASPVALTAPTAPPPAIVLPRPLGEPPLSPPLGAGVVLPFPKAPAAAVAPVEPLAAIPVASRPPLAMRVENAASELALPTQRRSQLPEREAAESFADLGLPVKASPLKPPAEAVSTGGPGSPAVVPAPSRPASRPLAEAAGAGVGVPAAPVGREDPSIDGQEPVGERRRRRQRTERRRPPEAAGSGVSWGRWFFGLLGLLLVVAVVVAIVARDQLPPEWRQAGDRWWSKAHQLMFPHQYGYPRRGVLPRAGETPPAPAATGPGTEAAAPPTGPARPGVVDQPGAADLPPETMRLIPETLPALETPPAPASAGPDESAIPVLRAELVEEDEEETPAPAAPVDAVDPAPPAPADLAAPPAGKAPAAEQTAPAAAPASAGPAADAGTADAGPVDAAASTAVESAPIDDLGGGGFTLWDGDDGARAMGVASAAGPSATARDAADPATAEVAEAQKAVRALVSASTVPQLLPWIFDAETLESIVRGYHAEHPLRPLSDAVIELEYSGVIPATGGKAHIFNVLDSSHPRGFPVSAESTPAGYRIDWQSYIQWRDAWLRRFIDSRSTDPETLFVVLRRTHYFNDDVPKLDEKLAFKLTSAVPGDEGAVAFVEKDSAVGRSLAELYEWRTMYFPVVELQWVNAGKQARYLRLNRIVRPTWRRIGE